MTKYPWKEQIIKNIDNIIILIRIFENSDEAWEYAKSHKSWYICCCGKYENSCQKLLIDVE